MSKKIYTCPLCGSIDVYKILLTNMNTGAPNPDYDGYWCDDCELAVQIEETEYNIDFFKPIVFDIIKEFAYLNISKITEDKYILFNGTSDWRAPLERRLKKYADIGAITLTCHTGNGGKDYILEFNQL